MTINTTYKEAFMLRRKPDENRSKIFIVDNIFLCQVVQRGFLPSLSHHCADL